MATTTYYVFQPFLKAQRGDRVIPGQPREMPTRSAAERAVRILSKTLVGGVAFSRSGDPTEGEWEDAKVLAQSGEVPEEFFDAQL